LEDDQAAAFSGTAAASIEMNRHFSVSAVHCPCLDICDSGASFYLFVIV
jgi:hypothetical protein